MARRPGRLPCTLGAHGLRLPHLFQKYVSPDTSAFRYAVRSAERGALCTPLSPSSWGLPLLCHHRTPTQPASQPSLAAPLPGARPSSIGGPVNSPLKQASLRPQGGDVCVVPGEGQEHRII